MTSTTLLAIAIAILPVFGLAALAWFTIMNEAATVHSFQGFDGMHLDQ